MFPEVAEFTAQDEVKRMIEDPEIDLDVIQSAFDSLPEEDRDRMPYVVLLIAFES